VTNWAKSAIRDMLAGIVRSLVDRPNDATIELVEHEDSTTLRVLPHSSDVGRLIGENGRTVHALRVVVNASAAKHGCGRFNVEIGEPQVRLPAGAKESQVAR
jgi:predicted RNA-binding protein YlqC (UPF0109 family)